MLLFLSFKLPTAPCPQQLCHSVACLSTFLSPLVNSCQFLSVKLIVVFVMIIGLLTNTFVTVFLNEINTVTPMSVLSACNTDCYPAIYANFPSSFYHYSVFQSICAIKRTVIHLAGLWYVEATVVWGCTSSFAVVNCHMIIRSTSDLID